jgi:hypothetical protein
MFQAPMQSSEPFMIVRGLENCWDTEMYLDRSKKTKTVGNVIWEAAQIQALLTQIQSRTTKAQVLSESNKGLKEEEWSLFWKRTDVGACPSIIQMFAFLPYHSICSGYPSKLVLLPYRTRLIDACTAWWKREDIPTKPWLYTRLTDNKLPFLRPHSSFLIMSIDGRNGEDDGAHSWIFGSYQLYARKLQQGGLERSVRERLTSMIEAHKNFKFQSRLQFSILPIVERLLRGEDIESLRKEVQSMMAIDMPYITLEAAVWLTLFALDGHIEAMWRCVEAGKPPETEDTDTESPEDGEIEDMPEDAEEEDAEDAEMEVQNTEPDEEDTDNDDEDDDNDELNDSDDEDRGDTDNDDSSSGEPAIEPETESEDETETTSSSDTGRKVTLHTASFLALWLTICHRVDPLSPPSEVELAFNKVLKAWRNPQNEDELCTELNEEDTQMRNSNERTWESSFFPGLGQSSRKGSRASLRGSMRGSMANSYRYDRSEEQGLKKAVFHKWASKKSRIGLMRDMLPWLQMRSILMFYFLLCHEDSSEVASRQNVEPIARVA